MRGVGRIIDLQQIVVVAIAGIIALFILQALGFIRVGSKLTLYGDRRGGGGDGGVRAINLDAVDAIRGGGFNL